MHLKTLEFSDLYARKHLRTHETPHPHAGAGSVVVGGARYAARFIVASNFDLRT